MLTCPVPALTRSWVPTPALLRVCPAYRFPTFITSPLLSGLVRKAAVTVGWMRFVAVDVVSAMVLTVIVAVEVVSWVELSVTMSVTTVVEMVGTALLAVSVTVMVETEAGTVTVVS